MYPSRVALAASAMFALALNSTLNGRWSISEPFRVNANRLFPNSEDPYPAPMLGPIEQALWHIRHRSTGGPIPRDLKVTLNFHPDTIVSGVTTIEWLAREGVYRSQFETGISNGGLTAHPGGDRWSWESRIFGGAYDTCGGPDLSLRPKYGALNYLSDPVGASRRFGSCHLRLRPHVLARTTFCYRTATCGLSTSGLRTA